MDRLATAGGSRPVEANGRVGRRVYSGLFMVTLATLTYEVLLTRIFSVTMWYHFAFVAVSIALFGMTLGALIVYALPRVFTRDRVRHHLALSSLLFGLAIVVSFLVHLTIPFEAHLSFVGIISLAVNYAVLSVPFVFSGVSVSLALTRFPKHVGKLYAADLAGAATGCIAVIYILKLTDGPTAVLVVAFFACVGAFLFADPVDSRRLFRVAVASLLVFGFAAAGHTILVRSQAPLLRLVHVKGEVESRALYEKWNSYSRIRVDESPFRPEHAFGWGMSSEYPFDRPIEQHLLKIDATAGTVLTAFDGDLGGLEHLKFDVTNVAHYMRPDSKVLVLGAGGGRDILSALAFEQRSITAVEFNGDIIDTVNKTFGDFTGHLDKHPKVAFVHDEARSFVARSDETFDIIHVSFTDTFAATAAGAFVFTESSLYTVEAWEDFLEHLGPGGVISFSRFYVRGIPGEAYRLAALASASLARFGVARPRDHILMVVRMLPERTEPGPDGVATILVSNEPFSAADLETVREVSRRLKFDVVLDPSSSPDPTLAAIAGGNAADIIAGYPIDVSPPTDDSPFFFHMVRAADIFDRRLWDKGVLTTDLLDPALVLGSLLAIVVILTVLFIAVPLALTADRGALRGSLPLFLFFGSIGLGFMLVEVSQLQRMNLFLGHPTFGLSVVLFTLLLSSGVGSYMTERISPNGVSRQALLALVGLVAALAAFGLLTPVAVRELQGQTTPVRVLSAAVFLFPIGVFMGTAFPLGMRVASSRAAGITPWLWGFNGAASVCASVLAVAIAINLSISASFWIGFSWYVVALGAFAWFTGEARVSLQFASGRRYLWAIAGSSRKLRAALKGAALALRDAPVPAAVRWWSRPSSATGLLLLVLTLAAWLRVDGLAWALPHIPHPDEARIVDNVIVTAGGIPGVVFSDYGPVPFHLLRVLGTLASLIVPAYSMSDPADAMNTYVLARFIAACFGVGTVALVFVAGDMAYGRRVGLTGAAFMAFAVLAIQASRTYTVDVFLVFWSVLFLVMALRFMRGRSDLLFLSLMIVTGIAIATKVVAIFLLIPLAAAVYHAARDESPGTRFIAKRVFEMLGGLVIVALTFLLLTPSALAHAGEDWWLDFNDPNWWHAWNFPAGSHRLLWNLLLSEGAVRPLWALASTPEARFWNPIASLLAWGIGPAMLIASGIGVVVALKVRSSADWLLVSFLLGAYLTVANSHVQFIRYAYPMVPVLAILAARPLSALPSGFARRPLFARSVYSAVGVAVVVTALYALAFTAIFRDRDTRLQAEDWVFENIPPGSVVGVDGPDRFSDPFVDPVRYRVHVLPVYQLYYDTTRRVFPGAGPVTALLGERVRSSDGIVVDADAVLASWVEKHLEADYLVLSNRLSEQVEKADGAFERIREYYRELDDGSGPFQIVKEFRSRPAFWRFELDDSGAEHTFRIFDHPTITIYKRTRGG